MERLRAQFIIKGQKLKQEEILEILISIGEVSPLLLEREIYDPLPKEEQERIIKDTVSLGKSSEETIDNDLYGR